VCVHLCLSRIGVTYLRHCTPSVQLAEFVLFVCDNFQLVKRVTVKEMRLNMRQRLC